MVQVGIVPRSRGTPGNRDFSLEPAAGTFSSSEPACRCGVPTPTHHTSLCARVHLQTHVPTPLLQHPTGPRSSLLAQFHPPSGAQNARTRWASGGQGSRRVCTP